jgi:hypothetical protein
VEKNGGPLGLAAMRAVVSDGAMTSPFERSMCPAVTAWPAPPLRRSYALSVSPFVPTSLPCRGANLGARQDRQRRLTLADIRSGSAATRALLSETEATLSTVRHRPMVLRLEILQSAVDDLCRLGWLDGADHRVDAAVLDAVAELVERAIALRLRPY